MAGKPKNKRELRLHLRRAIRDRLEAKFDQSPYENTHRLEVAMHLTHSAVAGWRNSIDPVTPDTVSLYRLSEELGFSVDWLLFGVGPDQRGAVRSTGEFATDLRAQLIATLHLRTSYSEEELNRFLPTEAAAAVWESVVSHFGVLLLRQNREEYNRNKPWDYFTWLLQRGLSGKGSRVRPFYEVEKHPPLL
jgi:transcriptional regulator with XRE-family HTH domain